SCQHSWQHKSLSCITARVLRNQRRPTRRHFPPERSYKAVALSGHGGDRAVTPFAITKRFAETGYVNPKVTRVHDQTAPHARDQFPLAHDLTSALHQHHQNIERSVAQRERNPVLFERAGRREESKRPKGKRDALR